MGLEKTDMIIVATGQRLPEDLENSTIKRPENTSYGHVFYLNLSYPVAPKYQLADPLPWEDR